MILLCNKGTSKLIPVMVVIALAVAFAFVLVFMQYGEHFKIVYVIKSSEADRHVINMAQVFMSYPKLLKNDDYVTLKGTSMTRLHRAVLDAEKLEVQMVSKDFFQRYRTLARESDLAKDVKYPDTVYSIVVEDMEDGRYWVLSSMGTIVATNVEEGKLGLKTNDMGMLFQCLSSVSENAFNPGQFWNIFNPMASICESATTSKLKVVQKTFPVAIAYKDLINTGRLTIRMTEW